MMEELQREFGFDKIVCFFSSFRALGKFKPAQSWKRHCCDAGHFWILWHFTAQGQGMHVWTAAQGWMQKANSGCHCFFWETAPQRTIGASRSWQVVFVLQLLTGANSNQVTVLQLQRGQQKQEGRQGSKCFCWLKLGSYIFISIF